MAKGGRPTRQQKVKKRRRVVKSSSSSSSTSGRIRPDVIKAPLPKFVHLPSQREVDSKAQNTWYYRTPLTINNRYTPNPNRVFEPGRGKADTVWL